MIAHPWYGALDGVGTRRPETAARRRQQVLLLKRDADLRELLTKPSQLLHGAVRYPKAKS